MIEQALHHLCVQVLKVNDQLIGCHHTRLQRPQCWLGLIKQVTVKLTQAFVQILNPFLISLQSLLAIFSVILG